jgi:integrase
MPLKLKPPRQGKTPYWSVRGTYLGAYVDKTTGATRRETAAKVLREIKSNIESGRFSKTKGPTFLSAAADYIHATRQERFLKPLVEHLGETPLSEITQKVIDSAALELYPTATPATRNRQVHTIVSAVLKHAGIEQKLKRPKGAAGRKRIEWLEPAQAFALIEKATERDPEFGAFVTTLLYTGMRLSEATGMEVDRVNLRECLAYLPTTKSGEPRGVYLPPIVVEALANHPRGLDRPGTRVFRFRKSTRLYAMFEGVLEAAEITLPPRTGFHVLRHTWATWMRRAGLDTLGLVQTGAWSDLASAARYAHVVPREEARRADQLPVPPLTGRALEQIRGKSVDRPSILAKTG